MPVTNTTRLGLRRPSAETDPEPSALDDRTYSDALDALAAGFIERTLGTLPAPGAALDGFFCLITDVGPPGGRLYYCDATRWIEVGADYSLFGDGSDGDVTIVADSTLTRDMHYGQLTVNAGVRLDTGGFRIFARKSIVNNGVIHRDGTVGTGVGGTAKAAGTVGGGGAGGVATAAAYQLGGTGGASNNGSAAGFAAANPPEAEGGVGVFRFAPSAVFGRTVGGTVVGGGSGGRNNTAGTAGGGGGGGVVMVAAPSFLGSGTYSAKGGAGSADTGGGGSNAGGGGGGGVIVVVSATGATVTTDVSGGAPGADGGSLAATAGSAGRVYLVELA